MPSLLSSRPPRGFIAPLRRGKRCSGNAGAAGITADQLARYGRRGWCGDGSRGWILCAGVTVLGWLAAEPGSLGGALQVGTLLWLLSNGVGVRLADIPITLVPWGATAVIAFMISRSRRRALERFVPTRRLVQADQRRHGCRVPAASPGGCHAAG